MAHPVDCHEGCHLQVRSSPPLLRRPRLTAHSCATWAARPTPLFKTHWPPSASQKRWAAMHWVPMLGRAGLPLMHAAGCLEHRLSGGLVSMLHAG